MERFASSVPRGTDEWNRDAGLHLGSFRDRWSGLLRWARSWGGGAPGGRSEGTRASYFQRQASRRELVALGGDCAGGRSTEMVEHEELRILVSGYSLVTTP